MHSTATPAQTQQVADAVESLHAAYLSLFADHVAPSTTPLILVLYRDADEFARNNRSRPWAEAYYLRGVKPAASDVRAASTEADNEAKDIATSIADDLLGTSNPTD